MLRSSSLLPVRQVSIVQEGREGGIGGIDAPHVAKAFLHVHRHVAAVRSSPPGPHRAIGQQRGKGRVGGNDLLALLEGKSPENGIVRSIAPRNSFGKGPTHLLCFYQNS